MTDPEWPINKKGGVHRIDDLKQKGEPRPLKKNIVRGEKDGDSPKHD